MTPHLKVKSVTLTKCFSVTMFFQPTAVVVLLVVSISGDEELNDISSYGGSSEERQQQTGGEGGGGGGGGEQSKNNDSWSSIQNPSRSPQSLPSDLLISTDAYSGVSGGGEDGRSPSQDAAKQEGDGLGSEGGGGGGGGGPTLEASCPCPCSDKGSQQVCGQTTYGITKAFPSECHLICYNMCSTSVRYALVRSEICLPPVPPVLISDVSGQASYLPGSVSFSPGSVSYPAGLASFMTSVRRQGSTLGPAEWTCDCGYCPVIDRLRPDYYPICAERMGRRTTFDSWCHFDCENRCYENTKQPHVFLHRGACVSEPQYPGSYPIVIDLDRDGGLCRICGEQCRNIFEPVCARGALSQYLPFKSLCHLRCYNQCNFYNSEAQYYQVHDADCRWAMNMPQMKEIQSTFQP